METVDYSDIVRGTSAKASMLVTDLAAADLALLREYHNTRMRNAWQIHRWPQICPTEQRQFAPSYDTSGDTTYAAGATVLDVATLNYFQSLVVDNAGNPPTIASAENSAFWALCRGVYQADDWATGVSYTVGMQVRNVANATFYQCTVPHTSADSIDLTKFGKLTPFVRRIAYEQAWDDADGNALLPIGAYLEARDRDPQVTTKTRPLFFTLDPLGAVFTSVWRGGTAQLAYVWLTWRLRLPNLTGDPWDETAVYTSGQQMYFQDPASGLGNFYTCATPQTSMGDSPIAVPASWTIIAIPAFLKTFLIAGGAADWLAKSNLELAEAYEAEAEAALELEVDNLQRQEQQVRRFTYH